MNTLAFARQHIRFDRSSLISGAWDDARYPHMRRPLAANDNLETKSLVIYKAAGCMGTVYLQILIAKHILCDVGDIYFVAQDDEAAKTWGVSRGQGFVLSIPDIWRLRRASLIERSCFTQDQWRFRHMDLYITGPSKTNRQSKQMRRVFTDESHLTDNYEDGALSEFDDRTQNWDWAGSSVHATTAADSGAEVDRRYYDGKQHEYHWRCPECDKLIWPLWREVTPSQKSAQDVYKKDVFLWDELDTEDATLDTIRARCPHCDAIFQDNINDRSALCGEDYVAMNPNAKRGFDSWRWNVFALPHLEWRKVLALYRTAIEAAKFGNMSLLENFAKKQLCASWTNVLPDFGEGKGSSDYKMGDVWRNELETERFMASDRQAGKGDEGEHLWVLVTEYDRAGNSRRLDYRRLLTYDQKAAMQQEFGVKDENVLGDSGHETKSTIRVCGEHRWYATRGTDETEFPHKKTIRGRQIVYTLPYSAPILQSGIIGQKSPDKKMKSNGFVPYGWALQILMANPTLYAYLAALIGGKSGRYFGIADDFPSEYKTAMPGFIQIQENDKFGRPKKPIWKPVRATHPWDCEVQCLLGAIRAGYFPLAKIENQSHETQNILLQ